VKAQVTAIAFIGQLLAVLICGVDVVVISPEITVNVLRQFKDRPESAE
jgi:hypothetical protein